MSDLAQLLQAVRDHVDEETTRQEWHVTDRGSAQWAMQRLYELKREEAARHDEADAVRAPLEAQLALVDAWEKQEINRLEQSVQFFEGELIRWLAHERAQDPQLKSVKLAHGTVASRQKPDGIEIDDEAALINFLSGEAEDDLIRVETKLNKSAIKERVLKDGQVFPHVKRIAGDLVYEVKVAEVTTNG